jgi:pimeloyl-ACP methyl ester carboxylesterase
VPTRWTTPRSLAVPAARFGAAATAVATAVVLATAAAPAAQAATSAPAGPAIHLGGVTLRKCESRPLAFCGHVSVPLDYSSPASPLIRIGFRWIPATGRPAGTVLAVEGGPGYSSIGTQPQYLEMLGPLRRSRNLLMVDLRGTGTSTPVNCPGLENFTGIGQYGPRFNARVAACGYRLNHTWRYRDTGPRGGDWVHASDLFNTAYSARDVSGVLKDLRLGRVDLYGDSYGSWFSQTFASRYPDQLRSVTLDSTYQVLNLDPWYVTTVITARRAFDAACQRWPACARIERRAGPAWSVITSLASRLRLAPVTGETTTASGTRGRLTVTLMTLVNLVNNAGFDPVVYRDLYAAALALLNHHDAAPLLRTAALSLGFDDTNYSLPEFSDGLYFAVSCTDYVQLFSRTAPPAVRARQYAAALRRKPANTFAPFTVSQWTNMDQYTEAYNACLNWPTPTHLFPPITRRPPLVSSRLPVLVMSGDLDSLTPRLHGATLVTRQMGPSARLVTFPNLTHVMLQDANDACPALVFQRFLRDPANLRHENVSCAPHVTPIHSVASYPRLLVGAAPAKPGHGNTAGAQALKAVTVALAAVGDEISRFEELSGRRDRGLRGGTVTFSGGQLLTITLSGVRWVINATVDGRARWNQVTGLVTADLTVRPDGGTVVPLVARWDAFAAPGQLAIVTGTQGRTRLVATAPAP